MKPVVDVSVVVPCFACAGTIERAVASVAAQTCRPLELILVNDASLDETAACLQRLHDQYPEWVHVVHLGVNVGAGEARNAGWSVAKCKYIAFLDADDSWHPRKLEWQFAFMQAHPEIALSGHAHVIGSGAADLTQMHLESSLVSKWAVLASNPFVTPSVMLRKEIAQRFCLGQRHMEDHLLWMNLVCDGLKIARLNLPMVTVHKPLVGVSGLSGQIGAMSKADWRNYGLLFQAQRLHWHELTLAWIWVTLKFIRRMLMIFVRRFAGRKGLGMDQK